MTPKPYQSNTSPSSRIGLGLTVRKNEVILRHTANSEEYSGVDTF